MDCYQPAAWEDEEAVAVLSPALQPVGPGNRTRGCGRAWAGASFLMAASLAVMLYGRAGHEVLPAQASLEDLTQILRLNQELRGADAQVDIPFEGINYSKVFNETGSRPGRLSGDHRTVTLAGFSRPELNARFTERFGLDHVVGGRETYWTVDFSYFLYWCAVGKQWIVGWGESNFHRAKEGTCDYTAKGPLDQDILDPNMPRGWSEWKDGQLVDAPKAGVHILSTMEWLNGFGSMGSFDSLDVYPMCKRPPFTPINFTKVYTNGLTQRQELTSNTNYNQGSCNNCWAITVSELIARLLCVTGDRHFEGPRALISPAYITSCAAPALVTPEDGCAGGGKPLQALWWVAEHGVPTGGNHISDQTCVPFFRVNSTKPTHAPSCPTSCTSPGYPRSLAQDLFVPSGLKYTYQTSALESALKAMRAGPIAIVIPLYEDFYNYTGGIYRHTSGKRIGNHVMIAHGYNENYLNGFNSWGPAWGYMGNFRLEKSFPLAFIIPGEIKGTGHGFPYPLPKSVKYVRIDGFENSTINGRYAVWLHQLAEINDHASWWKGDDLVMYWCSASNYWAIADVSELENPSEGMWGDRWAEHAALAARRVRMSLSKSCSWKAHGPALPAYESVPHMQDIHLKGWFEKSTAGLELARPLAGIQERG